MNLLPGLMLGKHRLVDKIGEGGMGVVWKGIDTSLDREVAIKILPEHFASDAERLARFEREAKLLATLNHPGIATIHGFHEAGGVHFLVMELVPGMDLAQRLSAGPMPVEEALEAGLGIARALEAAHESGVIHRDLKPANIKMDGDGTIKILDFGLAKVLEPDLPEGSSLSPTLTTPATRAGVILGTAAYMSPEQAKGKRVDRRTDIWAFGCVLYEMLTGRRPFSGEGVSEILAAVIMAPAPLDTLPGSVPPPVRKLLGRCLEKDPHRRLRDIGEARFLIEETLAGGMETSGPDAAARSAGRRISMPLLAGGLILAAAIGAALVWMAAAPTAPEPPRRRFEILAEGPFKGNGQGRLLAVSPDGRKIAYVDGERLMIRPIDRLEPQVIEKASIPRFIFWSPDSAWIAFAEEGKLWKAPAGGGPGTAIVDLPEEISGGSGGSWGADGRIALALGSGSLYEVSARGGEFQVIARVDPDQKENDFHEPCFLPDGSLIATIHKLNGRPDRLVRIAGGERTTLLAIEGQDIWHPTWSPTGHILYRRHPTNPGLWALPFSPSTGVAGESFLVSAGGDVPSVASDGTLVHTGGTTMRRAQLVWVDREGKILEPIGEPQKMWPFPELSPDERYLAISEADQEDHDVYVLDLERATRTRLTFDDAENTGNVTWSAAGDRVFFEDGQDLDFTIKMKSSDGSGEVQVVTEGWGPSPTPDNRYLVYANQEEGRTWDLYYKDMDAPGEPVRFVDDPKDQFWTRVSPDGDYVVYLSYEADGEEVFIRPFPAGAGKQQVSIDGGRWPRWSHDGKKIYYVHDETMMEVDVETQPSLHLGRPRALFSREPLGWTLIFAWQPGFDVTDDEQRFVIATPAGEREKPGIVVVENWISEFSE